MLKNFILSLFEYNYWANARILETSAKISAEQLSAPLPYSHGSLRGTLVHTLGAEWLWRMRCHEGVSPPAMLNEADYPTLQAIRNRWAVEEQKMRSFLKSATNEDLGQVITYRTTQGAPRENIRGEILAHVVLHGMQHRSEMAMILTNYGQSPGDIDLIAFLR